jgi:hypothetical protein
MKQLQLFTLFTWMLCISGLSAQGNEYSCKLLDPDNYTVAFYLKGDKGTLLKSDKNGVLKLSQAQMQNAASEVFTLHFSSTMAYQLYKSHVYFQNGQSTSDPHIDYDDIKLSELCGKSHKNYYVRRKELRLENKEVKKD